MTAAARRRRLALAVALAVAAAALWLSPTLARPAGAPPDPAGARLVDQGRQLFAQECSFCHGFDARGVADKGPSLRGVGAGAADFYLRTGRMPLSYPSEEPMRSAPRYTDRQIRALVAYVGSFGGAGIPRVDPASGSLSQGQQLFTSYCAGCHTITGEGGVATGAAAPKLKDSTPTDVAEALRTGPFLMPRFSPQLLGERQVDSIARYVQTIQHPDDAGGWGIGHIGPVPEGMVAWLLAGAALLIVARLIGERRANGSR